MSARAGLRQVLRTVTTRTPAPLCPELTLWLAAEPLAPWQAAEAAEGRVVGPPFWAHAWPGGCALARHVLEAPSLARGLRVLDFASGCGVSAIAAAKVGGRVTAAEVDPWALAALEENAALNAVQLELLEADQIGRDDGWELVLVGDVFYQADLSRRVEAWLRGLVARGAAVFIGDPGRSFLPTGLERVREWPCFADPAWDSVVDRPARVWRFPPR